MQPEYKVSVNQQVPTCTDIHFGIPAISQEVRMSITDLESLLESYEPYEN